MPNAKPKIKKGDKVIVTKGKDRGKSGKVLRVMASEAKVVVEGLNLFKKTVRATRQGDKGQIVDTPAPIRIENAKLVCGSCNKPSRIGYRMKRDKKERYCKKCEAKA